MVEQNWLSPQVKRSVVISTKLLVAKHNNDTNTTTTTTTTTNNNNNKWIRGGFTNSLTISNMDYLHHKKNQIKNQINLQTGKFFNKYDNSVYKFLNVG